MTMIFLIFQYFLHKKDFTAQGLVTVRRPTSVFFTNTGHPDVYNYHNNNNNNNNNQKIIIIIMIFSITIESDECSTTLQ